MTPENENCKTCKFWDKITDRPYENFGYCHIYPPFKFEQSIRPINERAIYPAVQEDGWCGEYIKV